MTKSQRLSLTFPICAFALILAAMPSSAATITWATWTSGTASATAGSATGSLTGLGIGLTYTGEMRSLIDIPFLPVTSFTGGTVGNAPPTGTNDSIQLFGGGTVVDTITFSAPVTNPILAIWSLGQPGFNAEFVFTSSEPFTIEGGGPNSSFGGASIFAGGTCPANAICGAEGNGVVQFNGTFSQITWTNPVFENYYTFTVGATGLGSAVPEPAAFFLLGGGLLGISVLRLRKSA